MITIIQMPTVPFDWMVQRPQHLMSSLSKKNCLVYYIEDKDGNYIKKISNNLYVLSRDYDFNNVQLISPVILWASCSNQVYNINKYPHNYVVYDVVDSYSDEFSCWAQYAREMEMRADLIFTSAENIYNYHKNRHQRVYLLNNAVDNDNFSLFKRNFPPDLPVGKKIVGYVGAIATWFDWDTINYITERKDINFVFIGTLYGINAPTVMKNNTFYLGHKEHSVLPFYINNFNCCIIPFKVTNMTNSCNPIKLYEYFSLAKPVVSTNMHELNKFSNLCYISPNRETFLYNINMALQENNWMLQNERVKIALANNWNVRANYVLEVLSKEFNINL